MQPFQWKRYTILALITITASRALIFPIGFSLSLSDHANIAHIPEEILYLSAFTFLYVSGIALAKDAPDIKGDKKYNILTLASKLGVARILAITFLLQTVAMFVGFFSLFLLESSIDCLLLPLQVLVFFLLIKHFFQWKNYEKLNQISSYYLKLWKFFYFEIMLFILLVASRYLALII